MVTEAGFAPYEYYENNEIVGVDVDIAREIAAAMGKELVIKDVAFDSIINEVKSGKADFGAAGISYSDERAEEVDFTINYTTSKQIVVVKEDSNITIDNLDNLRIAVQLGSVGDNYVTKNYPNAKVTRQKKYLAAIQDLLTDKVDCVVMDELPAIEILKNNSGLKILEPELFTDSYGMIVKKGNTELLNAINEVLKKLVEEGKIEEFVINHSEG
ncbi:MAG TPA: amino acid ABC transporter substrate-binding protein [Candidatus Onthocola stercoravium]|nr:amino acid ABC transporter substrate-binding protein [Candidatus Onthocola stercoravium]